MGLFFVFVLLHFLLIEVIPLIRIILLIRGIFPLTWIFSHLGLLEALHITFLISKLSPFCVPYEGTQNLIILALKLT